MNNYISSFFQTDTSNSPPTSNHHYTNSKFQSPYGLEDQHQIYNQINNNQPALPPNIFHGNNQHHHHLEPSTFNHHHQQPNNNNSNRTKRGVMSQQRGAVSQQSTPQLKKHLMYNQHSTQTSNPINYNNNQNHYQRQQQSFDHYSPLLIADDENDQQKTNHYDNNPHQPEHHSMNGKFYINIILVMDLLTKLILFFSSELHNITIYDIFFFRIECFDSKN